MFKVAFPNDTQIIHTASIPRNDDTEKRDIEWSPDGTKIVFTSMGYYGYEMYLIGVDGTGPTLLGSGQDPKWSPDGSKIVFISDRDGGDEIYVMAADGSDATITVVGSEAKRYKAAKRQITDRMMKRRRATMSADDVERNAVFLAASAVTDWHGWELDKKPAPCTPENVQTLLRVEHIRDQVEEAIRGHSDFFSALSEN